jgi:ribosomal protein S18 acetylase RimI-like enzyme
MRDLDPVLASWRELDGRFERVRATAWGAVVSDRRFPLIHDVNYARVEPIGRRLRFEEVRAELAGDLARARASNLHAVVFDPEHQTRLLSEASTGGVTLTWEILMARDADPCARRDDVRVGEIRSFGPTFWDAFRRSAREFGASDPSTVAQATALEAEVMLPAGRRWFTVRSAGRPAALGSLLAIGDGALIDHIVTFPSGRRRGFADAIVRTLCDEAALAGVRFAWLIADPDGPARRLYERLGFHEVAWIASFLSLA